MNHSNQRTFCLAVATLAFLCAMTVSSVAQDVRHPPITKTTAEPTHEIHSTHVQNAEVIHVSGHEIVVELENGKFELLNLGPDARFQVDGKDLTVHELVPGTRLSQEIHTVTTPKEVTTLRTLNGRVWHVNPARGRVIVSLPEGGNTDFIVPDDAVFHIDGKDMTLFYLRKGMNISATVLTVAPLHSVTRHTVVTGQAPPKPDVAFEGPVLIQESREVPTLTANVAEQPVQELPKTASLVPSIGLLSFLSLGFYAVVCILRSRIV